MYTQIIYNSMYTSRIREQNAKAFKRIQVGTYDNISEDWD